jgi:uncharacterized protein
MALLLNVQQLQRKSSLILQGEIEVEDLGIAGLDECIEPEVPLKYDFEASLASDGILIQGRMEISVLLTCVRCLKQVEKSFVFANWAGFVPLKGEDSLPVENDCVDLTPVLREDILLAFPSHPTCESGCNGLLKTPGEKQGPDAGVNQSGHAPSVWDELDKLKL